MSPREQFDFVRAYNWDDGVSAILPIINSDDCALEMAVLAYWRLEGPWNISASVERDLCALLVESIINGKYKPMGIEYDPASDSNLSKVQIYQLKNAGIPSLLFGPFGHDA
jgi:hypothetical protein